MDFFCRNISASSGVVHCHQPKTDNGSSLDDLFSGHPLEGEGDVNMEWLSIFVEDCLSSSAAAPSPCPKMTKTSLSSSSSEEEEAKHSSPLLLQLHHKSGIPGKQARSKRRRRSRYWSWSVSSDHPLLLQQAYWLADSELLIYPKNEKEKEKEEQELGRKKKKKKSEGGGIIIRRRCSHCLSQRTPQWRGGPLGPKTLCNACGVRYKSGRLLPEYRPARSPTFVSDMHSNSHKKVLEMRTSSLLCSHSLIQGI